MSLELILHDKTLASEERLLLDTHVDDSSLETLCSVCRAVDWPNATNIKPVHKLCLESYGRDILLSGKSSRAQLLASRCRVCRLIGNLVNPDLDGGSITTYCLRARGCIKESFCNGERSKIVILAVESPATGSAVLPGAKGDYAQFLLAHNFSKIPNWMRALQPSFIDSEFFKAKIQRCKEHHDECRRSTTSEATELYVIDVVTEETVPAKPGWEYIALSYVWGQESSPEHEKKFPSVVRDAMFVTNALGCRYLWVDRHCILQDSSHKQSMIQQMDRVYANSFVTIIAASGSGADDGLPGVRGPPRYHSRVRIGETRLFEMSNAASVHVKQSKWATRGWTYQEGCLSRRRLIFTKKEVLLLCNKLLVKETQLGHQADPYHIMATEERHSSLECDHETRIWKTFDWTMSLAEYSEDLEAQIEEYTSRNLSKDEDSLNAFLAILKHYELTLIDGCELSHLWGIPLMLFARPNEMEELVFFDLPWTGRPGAFRRQDFPSWSWSGWRGPVKFPEDWMDRVHILSPRDGTSSADSIVGHEHTVQVSVRNGDETIELHRFIRERELDTPRDGDSKELVITSFVIPLRFREIDTYPQDRHESFASPSSWRKQPPMHFLEFLMSPGIFLGIPMCLDREYDSKFHKCGLVLPGGGRFFKYPSSRRNTESAFYTIIILQEVGDERYERAGMVYLFYDARSGELRHDNSRTDWDMHLDEKGCAIPKDNLKKRMGSPNEYLFLEGREWKTVCLV